jgi:hypothetical protein
MPVIEMVEVSSSPPLSVTVLVTDTDTPPATSKYATTSVVLLLPVSLKADFATVFPVAGCTGAAVAITFAMRRW